MSFKLIESACLIISQNNLTPLVLHISHIFCLPEHKETLSNSSTQSEEGGGGGRGIPIPEEMADMLCGFNYLVYGLRERVAGGDLVFFFCHSEQK